MKIVSLTVTRNEEWVLGLSLRTALQWVDHAIVLDHASTDGTRKIVEEVMTEFPGRVSYFEEKNPVWMEMDHRQRTLDEGRKVGGTHFAIVDSDELPTANVLPNLRGWFEALKDRQLMDLPLIPVWGSLEAYRCDPSGMWQKSWLTLGWKDDGHCFWKAKEDGYQYHQRPPYGTVQEVSNRARPVGRHMDGGVMHLQFANLRRLRAKHAYYKMEEVVRWPGREHISMIEKKYSMATKENGLVIRPCPESWWKGYRKDLVAISNVPWHEDACRALWAKYGPERFKGLDLYALLPPPPNRGG
jgi:hypothetical protein